MSRSVWKGPFVDSYVLKKAEKAQAAGSNQMNGIQDLVGRPVEEVLVDGLPAGPVEGQLAEV